MTEDSQATIINMKAHYDQTLVLLPYSKYISAEVRLTTEAIYSTTASKPPFMRIQPIAIEDQNTTVFLQSPQLANTKYCQKELHYNSHTTTIWPSINTARDTLALPTCQSMKYLMKLLQISAVEQT